MLLFVLIAALVIAGLVASPMLDRQGARAALTGEGIDGEAHDLDAELDAGRQVTLMFWQPWCTSCRDEAPKTVQAAVEQAEHMRFFGVISEQDEVVDDGQIAKATTELGVRYPQIRDRDLSLARSLGVTHVPTFVVLGANREVVYRGSKPPTNWPKPESRPHPRSRAKRTRSKPNPQTAPVS